MTSPQEISSECPEDLLSLTQLYVLIHLPPGGAHFQRGGLPGHEVAAGDERKEEL